MPGFLWYRPLIPFSESTRHKFWLHCVKQSNQSFFNTFAGVVIWQEPFKTLTVLLVTRCCAPLSAVSNTHWVNNVFRCVYTLGKNFQPQSIETNSLWYNREWIPGFVKVVMLLKLFSRVLKKRQKKTSRSFKKLHLVVLVITNYIRFYQEVFLLVVSPSFKSVKVHSTPLSSTIHRWGDAHTPRWIKSFLKNSFMKKPLWRMLSFKYPTRLVLTRFC